LLKVVAYVELNPVKSEMAEFAWADLWSSVRVHLIGKDMPGLVNVDVLSEALLTIHEGQTEIAMIYGADAAINAALRLARATTL
jgi:hypothetical protein